MVQGNVGEFVDSSREGVVEDDRGFEEREVSFNSWKVGESIGNVLQSFSEAEGERSFVQSEENFSVFVCRD